MANHRIALAANRPVRAASAIEAMPVTSRLNTSGTMVIFSAFSHRAPRAEIISAVPAPPGRPHSLAAAPAARPPTSASRTHRLRDEKKLRDDVGDAGGVIPAS
jgi:hypothetical protein